MTSWGLGCGWLRHGRRNEWKPSIIRTTVVALLILALFFLIVVLAVYLSGCSGASGSGIRGTVRIGPTSPVATAGTTSDTKPYAARLLIVPTGGLHLKSAVHAKSGSDGTFSVNLAPGTYVIESDGGQMPPTLTPVTVKVRPGRYTAVTLEFDSGIR